MGFFWKPEDSRKIEKLKNLTNEFNKNNPDLFRRVIDKFRHLYPLYNITRFSYGIEEDRCMSFEINLNESNSYVVCISIFGYFLVWNINNFRCLDYGENIKLDDIFNSVILPNVHVAWISKNILKQEIPHFNCGYRFSGKYKTDQPIMVSDLLTRFLLEF